MMDVQELDREMRGARLRRQAPVQLRVLAAPGRSNAMRLQLQRGQRLRSHDCWILDFGLDGFGLATSARLTVGGEITVVSVREDGSVAFEQTLLVRNQREQVPERAGGARHAYGVQAHAGSDNHLYRLLLESRLLEHLHISHDARDIGLQLALLTSFLSAGAGREDSDPVESVAGPAAQASANAEPQSAARPTKAGIVATLTSALDGARSGGGLRKVLRSSLLRPAG